MRGEGEAVIVTDRKRCVCATPLQANIALPGQPKVIGVKCVSACEVTGSASALKERENNMKDLKDKLTVKVRVGQDKNTSVIDEKVRERGYSHNIITIM